MTVGELHRQAKVDETHLYGGVPIAYFEHMRRWHKTDEEGRPIYDPECRFEGRKLKLAQVRVEGTLGTWGPNGNGYNYWCKGCGYRCNPKAANE